MLGVERGHDDTHPVIPDGRAAGRVALWWAGRPRERVGTLGVGDGFRFLPKLDPHLAQ
jgi:hypothetical protein